MKGVAFKLAWAVLPGTDHARFPRLHFDADDGRLESPSTFVDLPNKGTSPAAPRCRFDPPRLPEVHDGRWSVLITEQFICQSGRGWGRESKYVDVWCFTAAQSIH